jgi:hypothetical protein
MPASLSDAYTKKNMPKSSLFINRRRESSSLLYKPFNRLVPVRLALTGKV